MNEFRGTNPQRHPQYLAPCGPLVLPPECRVTFPAVFAPDPPQPEHVPSYDNVSREGHRIYVPVCSCGWKGRSIAYKNRAIERALNHAKENNALGNNS